MIIMHMLFLIIIKFVASTSSNNNFIEKCTPYSILFVNIGIVFSKYFKNICMYVHEYICVWCKQNNNFSIVCLSAVLGL